MKMVRLHLFLLYYTIGSQNYKRKGAKRHRKFPKHLLSSLAAVHLLSSLAAPHLLSSLAAAHLLRRSTVSNMVTSKSISPPPLLPNTYSTTQTDRVVTVRGMSKLLPPDEALTTTSWSGEMRYVGNTPTPLASILTTVLPLTTSNLSNTFQHIHLQHSSVKLRWAIRIIEGGGG